MANDSSTGGPILPESDPPPQDNAFDLILQGLVSGITGLAVAYVRPRWAQVPSPVPEVAQNWCAVGVVDSDPGLAYFERHDGSADGGTGATTSQVQSDVRILASFYGSAARSTADLFRDGLMVPQNRESLFLAGIGLHQMPGTARFVPEIVNMQTRARVDVEFVLRVPSVRVWPIRNIVTVQGTIIAEDGVSVAFTAQD